MENLDKLEDAVRGIKAWCYAYPVEMFQPVTIEEWKNFHKVLKEHGLNGTAFTADCMRRVVLGIRVYVDSAVEALSESEDV